MQRLSDILFRTGWDARIRLYQTDLSSRPLTFTERGYTVFPSAYKHLQNHIVHTQTHMLIIHHDADYKYIVLNSYDIQMRDIFLVRVVELDPPQASVMTIART